MKILFISYGIWEYDGRLRELYDASCGLGDTIGVVRAIKERTEERGTMRCIKSNNYLNFIVKAVLIGLREDVDIIFADNRKAIVPTKILKLFKRKAKIILDVRELYLIKESKKISQKVGCIIESMMIKKADVVICANEHRAIFMQKFYNMTTKPIVYENIRRLEYSENFDTKQYEEKYKNILNKGRLTIISTSGWSISRTNDILAKKIVNLGREYTLLFVGGGTVKEKELMLKILEGNNNVYLLGVVEENELKYLMSHSDIGIVNYHQKDANNKYCASGKLFEFIFEEIPVVMTENDTLIEICNKYNIGECDNNYIEALQKIGKNYEYYKSNVENFKKAIDPKKNNKGLIKAIEILLREKK